VRRGAPGLALLSLALLLGGCVGGEPRRPGGPEPRRIEPELAPERRPAAVEPDPWSIEGALPRSGDPARPNVKVELTTLDVVSSRGLVVRAGARGSIVRGVVDVRAAVSASAGETRARSRTATFIVVQAGSAGSITLTDEARRWCGPWVGLHVEVLGASPAGVRVAIAPYVSPTARRGEVVEGATEVTLQPGEAVLLGGSSTDDARETRGTGGFAERAERRELLVLLRVDVLG
jgi:hypothetical protein